MQRFIKNYATPAFLLGIKFFTAFRTGLDTLIVAGVFAASVTTIAFINAVLYVLLIDAVMTGLWLYAAYGGDSQRAQLLKVFAITGAWTLYIGMVIIGWSAHPEAPFLALMGRLAGAIALGYDTWDTIAGPIRGGILKANAWFRRKLSGPAPEEVYHQVIDRALINAIRRSGRHIGNSVYEQIETRLADELPDVVRARLPLPSDFTDISADDENPSVVYADRYTSDALKQAWEICRQSLTPGSEFRRGDIETCTSLARSRVGDLINYAKAINEVVKIGHGKYMYNPIPVADISDIVESAPPANAELPPDF